MLKGLTLVLPHGTTTAVVGRSGAGKSTVAALLSRFYAPDSGSAQPLQTCLQTSIACNPPQAEHVTVTTRFLSTSQCHKNLIVITLQAFLWVAVPQRSSRGVSGRRLWHWSARSRSSSQARRQSLTPRPLSPCQPLCAEHAA